MTTTHKDPLAVIEQLVGALERMVDSVTGVDQVSAVNEARAALTSGREALKLRTCTWTQHDDAHMPGTYETECGELWSFVEGGPSDNKTKFCHGCGGLVYEPVGINGLTEAETSDTMSVLGLSKPTEPAPSTAGALIGCVQHDCADCKARAALLQSTPDTALAQIRDMFPVPAPGSALEPAWAGAMANPAAVPAYVRACLDARPVGELTPDERMAIIELLDKDGHDGTDFEAECPSCTAREKLAAARTQPERVPLPLMSAAFRTTITHGPSEDYRMVFNFKDLDSLHAADDEWRNFKGTP